MAGIRINDLKSSIATFARQYMFHVYFTVSPITALLGDGTAYLVRATSLPEEVIDPIEIPWQGQMYKIGSTHTFNEWTCTFNLDGEANLRKWFIQWMDRIHSPETNIHGQPSDYFGTANLQLLDPSGDIQIEYWLEQIWPNSIGALDLAYDSKEVAQFDVTFTYNWHRYE